MEQLLIDQYKDRNGIKYFLRCIITALLFTLFLLWAPANSYAVQNQAIMTIGSSTIEVNGLFSTMDAVPFIENNRVFVPVRYLASALGISEDNIKWNPYEKKVDLIGENKIIGLSLGSNSMYINNEPVHIDVAPVERNGRIYLPARYVAEALDYEVGWDEYNQGILVGPRGNLPVITKRFSEEETSLMGLDLSNLKIEPIARKGDWLYFVAPYDPHGWIISKLYRIKINGTGQTLIADDIPQKYNIKISGEWIYYKSRSDHYNLYRVGLDGKDKSKLSNEIQVNYIINDNFIYYSSRRGLYRINPDGSAKIALDSEDYDKTEVSTVIGSVVDGWLYYTKGFYINDSYNKVLYRIRLDGSDRMKIVGGIKTNWSEGDYAIYEGHIYYTNNLDGGKLYRIKVDGTESTLISDDMDVRHIKVKDGWIYYHLFDTQGMYRYKIDVNGNYRTEVTYHEDILADSFVKGRNIAGDYLYYSNLFDNRKLYKIGTNGQGNQLFFDQENCGWEEVTGDWLYFNIYEGNQSIGRFRIRIDGSGFEQLE